MTTRYTNPYKGLDPWLRTILLAGSTIAIIVSSAPWVGVISPFVTKALINFPLVKLIGDLLAVLIPWLGPNLAGLWILFWDHVGSWGPIVLYLLLNAMEVGLIGGPLHCGIAYVIDSLIALQAIPIYGDGLGMLIDNLINLNLDPSLFALDQVVNLLIALFGTDAIWWMARQSKPGSTSTEPTPKRRPIDG